ncbi:MAG: hypothetical protein LBR88_06130 [Zoogloeaceae bacterium]|nr:hypothetical protein [Zoogloeaceae bacterium]
MEPLNLLGTLRMNSTFLEFRDKFFLGKAGEWVLITAFAVGLFTIGFIVMLAGIIPQYLDGTRQASLMGDVLIFAFIGVADAGFAWFGWKYRCGKDFFRYTHYPMRFNRKNRKVYFFRLDGTVRVDSVTDPKGALEDLSGNWQKTRESWRDHKLVDPDTWAALPLLEKTCDTFKLLIDPLTDVAKHVLLHGRPGEIALKNKPALILDRFIGNWLSKFVSRVAGPMARVFQSHMDSGRMSPILAYMAAANRQAMVLIHTPGSTWEMADNLLKHLVVHSTLTSSSMTDIAGLVENRVRVLQTEAMGGSHTLAAIMHSRSAINMEYDAFCKIRDGLPMFDGMTEAQKTEFKALLNRSLTSAPLEIQDAMREGRYRDAAQMLGLRRAVVHAGSLDEATRQLRRDILAFRKKNRQTVRGFGIMGTFQGLLSWASMASAVKGIKKAIRLEENKFDAWGRLVSAVASALYTISSAVAEGLRLVPAFLMRHRGFVRSWLKPVSKLMFKAAAYITAGLDFIKGIATLRGGKTTEGGLLLASALAAFLSTAAHFAKGWPMVILFLVSVAIVAAIEIVTDDAYQKWLAKCIFGVGDSDGEHYKSMDQEMLALEEAGK